MRSLWEHILLEAETKEKTYPTYTAKPESIWRGIRYNTIDGAVVQRERCNTDPDGLLNDLKVSAGQNKDLLNETEVIQDLYKIYKQANENSDLSDVVLQTELVQNSSGKRKGIRIRFQPLWKTHYQKDGKPNERKSMQICCFWMKSIAVAAFRSKRVQAKRIIDRKTEAGVSEGNLKVEVVDQDDAILVYLAKRIEQWDIS